MPSKAKDKFSSIIEHIKMVYLAYNRPLIVGFSGGKDSTLVLQLVWEAIEGIPEEERKHHIYVISSDTLVETPYIESYLLENIKKINETATAKSLPISAHLITPPIEHTFWVNLIGRGYPAPSRMFRWCTERLKIDPTSLFIKQSIDTAGEVTIILGARKDESASRSQVLSKKVRDAYGLSKHTTFPSAYVYTPIESLSTEDVWDYLMAEESRWGMDNNILSRLYQSAADAGECPMVLDQSTPSCGNSRFGCWTCTVVTRDRAMENLIENGQEWMRPLLEFRDFLSETQVPENKHIYRTFKRRNGKFKYIKDREGNAVLDEDGTPKRIPGPYKFEWRKEFLKKLLKAQGEVRMHGPDKAVTLISREELDLIREIWREEEHDWEDSVPKIYKEVTGEELYFEQEDGVHFTVEDLELLREVCKSRDLSISLIARLIDLERRMQGMSRRAGIVDKLDKLLSEDWEPEEAMQDSRHAS